MFIKVKEILQLAPDLASARDYCDRAAIDMASSSNKGEGY